MTAPRHAIVLGMGLMGCDIAAIFLAGGWRVTAVETNACASTITPTPTVGRVPHPASG